MISIGCNIKGEEELRKVSNFALLISNLMTNINYLNNDNF